MRLVLGGLDCRVVSTIARAVPPFVVKVAHRARAVMRPVLHQSQPCGYKLLAQPEKFVALSACAECEALVPCLAAQSQRLTRQIHYDQKPFFRGRGIQIVCRVAEIFERWCPFNRRTLNFGSTLPRNSVFVHFLPQFQYPSRPCIQHGPGSRTLFLNPCHEHRITRQSTGRAASGPPVTSALGATSCARLRISAPSASIPPSSRPPTIGITRP